MRKKSTANQPEKVGVAGTGIKIPGKALKIPSQNAQCHHLTMHGSQSFAVSEPCTRGYLSFDIAPGPDYTSQAVLESNFLSPYALRPAVGGRSLMVPSAKAMKGSRKNHEKAIPFYFG